MAKVIPNEYQGNDVLTADQIRTALSGDFDGFKYFFENCMLMQDRDTRQMIHPKMNRGQEMIARTILEYVAEDTRATTHRECVIIGPRQFGKSTVLTAIANYIEAYVKGMENLNIVHTLHTGDAAAKFFKQKISPILTNVHPYIYPTIERDSSTASSLLQYKDVKGIRRGGYYEVLSAGSNSVRSGTVSVWLCDEPSEYRNPEAVEDAISGAISSYGWSFTAYIGTFSDRLSSYFLNKIQTAADNPNEMQLVFIPWFWCMDAKEMASAIRQTIIQLTTRMWSFRRCRSMASLSLSGMTRSDGIIGAHFVRARCALSSLPLSRILWRLHLIRWCLAETR